MAENPEIPEIPQAIPARRPRWSVQLVWLIPLIAALIGAWLAIRAVVQQGPRVTINFKTAEGLESGKTRIKYKDVDIGVVKTVTLAEDRAGVVVTADLAKQAEGLLGADTRFWVVRARIIGGTVSGIGTLFSGSYIGMDAAKAPDSTREFTGLETPPVITSGLPGKQYVLKSEDIGSLDIGSPIYFRRLQAGQVIAYDLDKDGKGVVVKVFVNSPYDRYINSNTRFWHASGIDVNLDATGIKFNTESLVSVLVGGLAFQTPEDSASLPAVEANTVFNLFGNRAEAMRQPDTVAETYVLVFKESVRGLSVGAPVDFRGVIVGEVKKIDIAFDKVKREFQMSVEIDIYPERFRRRYRKQDGPPPERPSLDRLVERGFRAQLRSGNLLTGQLYVALDFFPKERPVKLDLSKRPLELPTVAGSLQELQTTIASIAKKLEKVEFEELSTELRQTGSDLRKTLRTADKLLTRVEAEITPDLRDTMAKARGAIDDASKTMAEARKALTSLDRTLSSDSPLQQDAGEAMRELARAAQAFRALADYLERHPDALIRGKRKEEP